MFKYMSTNRIFFSVLAEPPSYRPLRPRSTSEAISAVSKDDLHSSRGKDELRAHSVHVAACISSPQEDDRSKSKNF